MKRREIYTNDFILAIKRKTAAALARYIAVAAVFAALCVAFCLLAAFDCLNIYVCCAFNILLTVAFLWFSYLFFVICFKKYKEKSVFVKSLENAYPLIYDGTCASLELGEQYTSVNFEDGKVLKLDCSAPNEFIAGKRYRADVVNDVIISYGEVSDE